MGECEPHSDFTVNRKVFSRVLGVRVGSGGFVSSPLEWSLVEGPIPVALTVVSALLVIVLSWTRRARWWTRAAPICVAVAVAVTVGLRWVIEDVAAPFPDRLPWSLYGWVGLTVLTVALAVARVGSARWTGRVLLAFGMVLSVVIGAAKVNEFFDQYTTLRAVLGPLVSPQADFASVRGKDGWLVRSGRGKPLADVWHAPAGMPDRGAVSTVEIPSSGGFGPRAAWLYLPPAYLVSPRAELPVLVLLSGQPGTTRDWLDGGHLADMLDDFARAHQGLAPVVVMPDILGSYAANPLCLDSRLGQVETYLAKDVPAWIQRSLAVTDDHRRWAVGGFSLGGTCSLQLAVRAPEVYRSFVDLSGQREPTLGGREQTVAAAFGGDQAAFARVNPLDILAAAKFPGSAGFVAVGRQDETYRPQQRTVSEACRAAGMDVRYEEVDGGHSWKAWRPAFQRSLPWLAAKTELTG